MVSIQLMSPASGDSKKQVEEANQLVSFHSINVPSEWGHYHYSHLKPLL